MITNYLILPHPLLQPFVYNYMLSTSGGEKVLFNSTWPASNETSLIFFMADHPFHFANNSSPSSLQRKCGCVVGLQSACNGNISFNGVCHTFIIQFKANGYSKLFNIPAKELTNQLHCTEAIFGKAAGTLNDKLQHAKDVQEMAGFADEFLLHFLNRHSKTMQTQDGINFVVNQLYTKATFMNIENYARKANMSVRNFGRRFIEQVGVSPKVYCRMLRFNNAVNTRIKKPGSNWTSIAHECDYYDQMHMIRDFKEFADVNPGELFNANKKLARPRMNVNGSSNNILKELNKSLENEKFIPVFRTHF